MKLCLYTKDRIYFILLYNTPLFSILILRTTHGRPTFSNRHTHAVVCIHKRDDILCDHSHTETITTLHVLPPSTTIVIIFTFYSKLYKQNSLRALLCSHIEALYIPLELIPHVIGGIIKIYSFNQTPCNLLVFVLRSIPALLMTPRLIYLATVCISVNTTSLKNRSLAILVLFRTCPKFLCHKIKQVCIQCTYWKAQTRKLCGLSKLTSGCF